MRSIDVRDVCAKDQGRFVSDRKGLEQRCLAKGELDGVGRGGDERRDDLLQIFDPGEKARLVEKAMIDCNVEAPLRFRVKETLKSG